MPAEIQNTFCILYFLFEFCIPWHNAQGIYNYYNWIIIIITQRNYPKYYLTEECETCFGNQSELTI